jgi:hypothetical protein
VGEANRAEEVTRPRYKHIEFCRNAETLWGKIRSGRWDWLGVHPDGRFVLGSPPTGRIQDGVGLEVVRGDAEEGRYGVVLHTPGGPAGSTWCESADEARGEFDRCVREVSDREDPELVRVRLVLEGKIAREEFLVRRPSTYR